MRSGVCRDKMRNRGVTRARLIATEACRAAGNGAAFQQEVRDKLGLDLEIIGRDTEAALAATGCTPLIDRDARGVILFDIGGGSSELVRLGQSEPVTHGPPKPSHRGLGVAAGRRGDARRTTWRPRWSRASFMKRWCRKCRD